MELYALCVWLCVECVCVCIYPLQAWGRLSLMSKYEPPGLSGGEMLAAAAPDINYTQRW